MPNRALIDAGPLIALFDRSDRHHQRCLSFLQHYRGILISTVAVVTEVTHLLDFDVRTQIDFIEWIARGAVTLEHVSTEDILRVIELSKKYADLPLDFADASLMAIGERLDVRDVISLDKDFGIYRGRNKRKLNLLL